MYNCYLNTPTLRSRYSVPTLSTLNMLKVQLCLVLLCCLVVRPTYSFCAHGIGGVGEYHSNCPDSVDMEACYARCNCWTDFPDMGGQVTHEVDALCMMDACWCSYNQDLCPYGTLKTNPYCCTKVGITCDDIVCDTDGECHTKP